MAEPRLHPLAEAELVEAARYYEARSSGLGERFIASFHEAAKRIGRFPEANRPFFGGIRGRPLVRFPYTLFYESIGSETVILAVAHNRRRPGYWRSRAQGTA